MKNNKIQLKSRFNSFRLIVEPNSFSYLIKPMQIVEINLTDGAIPCLEPIIDSNGQQVITIWPDIKKIDILINGVDIKDLPEEYW